MEFLCHDINVHVPHHISTAIPSYRLRQAHEILKANWGEYIKERKFTWEMMKDITDKCHLYEQNEFYQTFREFDANN